MRCLRRAGLGLLNALALGAGVLGVAPTDAEAREATATGRVSLRSYYSADDAGYQPVGISFLETDLLAEKLTDLDLRLLLDATFIVDATEANERRFGETEGIGQVRQLFIEQPLLLGMVDVTVGRKLVFVAGNAWVDGLDLEFWFDQKRSSVGVYGGLSPDRFDRSITADYQAAGGYATFHRDGFDASVAYNTVLYQGELDRNYAFGRFHWKLAPGLFASSYLTVDFATDPQVTTLLATVDYTPTQVLNFSLNLSRYSVEQWRNQQVFRNVIEPNQALILGDEVLDLVYNRARLSGSLRLWRTLYHYQALEAKQRSQDDREAYFYTFGLREEDFMGWGTDVDLQCQIVNNFQSDSFLVALDVRHDFSQAVQLNFRTTWFDGKTVGRNTDRGRSFDEAQNILLAGAGVTWRVTRSHHLDVWYDAIYEAQLQDQRNAENLLIHTGMLRYSWLF